MKIAPLSSLTPVASLASAAERRQTGLTSWLEVLKVEPPGPTVEFVAGDATLALSMLLRNPNNWHCKLSGPAQDRGIRDPRTYPSSSVGRYELHALAWLSVSGRDHPTPYSESVRLAAWPIVSQALSSLADWTAGHAAMLLTYGGAWAALSCLCLCLGSWG